MLQLVNNPTVDAFTGLFGCNKDFAVQVRCQSQHEFAGKGLFRGLAKLGAEIKIIVYGFPECLLDLINSFSLKGNNTAQPDNLAVENPGLVVIFNFSGIHFILHHCLIPRPFGRLLKKIWYPGIPRNHLNVRQRLD